MSEYTNPTSGQVWMAARWYNPATASFQSRDTYNGQTANPISLNRYTYAHSSYMNGIDPTGRWHTETDWAALEACAMAGIDCGWASTITVPDPGDACGIGAVYSLIGTCVVVCDTACFQSIADGLQQAAYVEACVNGGNLIGLDGTCQKPWQPGDACGVNGIRGLDTTICVERQEPGTACGWNGITAVIGNDGITCNVTDNLWTPTDPCQNDSSLCGTGASDDPRTGSIGAGVGGDLAVSGTITGACGGWCQAGRFADGAVDTVWEPIKADAQLRGACMQLDVSACFNGHKNAATATITTLWNDAKTCWGGAGCMLAQPILRDCQTEGIAHCAGNVTAQIAIAYATGKLTPNPGSAAATSNGSRGLSNLGGIIEETGSNAAGGRIFTSTGAINQNDFAGIVQSSLMKGDQVSILTGAHGLPNGSLIADASMLADDVAAFGKMPGVSVHNVASMSPAEISAVLQRPGTIIGGFCDSGACLSPYRGG